MDLQEVKVFKPITRQNLGMGVYGTVDLFTDHDGKDKALKTSVSSQMLINEIDVMSTVDHPYIMKIERLIYDEKYPGGIGLVMPVVSQLEIMESYSDEERMVICHQVFNALWWLLEQKILYLDLKPSNILIGSQFARGCEPTGKKPHILLSDFGLTARCLDVKVGTVLHREVFPDVIRPYERLQETGSHCNESSVIWSAGVFLYHILSREYFIPSWSVSEIYNWIKENLIDDGVRKQIFTDIFEEDGFAFIEDDGVRKNVVDLLVSTLNPDSKKRPTMLEVLQSPLFAGMDLVYGSSVKITVPPCIDCPASIERVIGLTTLVKCQFNDTMMFTAIDLVYRSASLIIKKEAKYIYASNLACVIIAMNVHCCQPERLLLPEQMLDLSNYIRYGVTIDLMMLAITSIIRFLDGKLYRPHLRESLKGEGVIKLLNEIVPYPSTYYKTDIGLGTGVEYELSDILSQRLLTI